MKTKLFTTNAFFLLIGLVLALGVQNTADALTFRDHSANDGDFQVVRPGEPFDISFTVNLGSDTTAIRDNAGELIADSVATNANSAIDSGGYYVSAPGSTYRTSAAANALGTLYLDTTATNTVTGTLYVTGGSNASGRTTNGSVITSTGAPAYTAAGARAVAAPDAKVPDANRYHFNQEAINITVDNNAMITHVNNQAIVATATHAMAERNPRGVTQLISSIRLRIQAGTAAGDVGAITITITDTTPTADKPAGPAVPPLVFTVYVVYFQTATPAIPSSPTLSITSQENRCEIRGATPDQPISFVSGYTPSLPITAEVISGPGQLYMQRTSSSRNMSRPMKKLFTSTDATVMLDMRGGSSTVRFWIEGDIPANTNRIITYINGYADIEITSGNHQTGVAGGQLEKYLGAKVKDATGRPVPLAPVVFGTTLAGNTTAMFIPYAGTTVYLAGATLATAVGGTITSKTVATASSPPAAAAIVVESDRSGEAKCYYQVGTDLTESQNVTVTSCSATTSFTVNGVDSRAAKLELVSGDNQRASKGDPLKDPLVVRVRDLAGYRIPNIILQFRSIAGTFTRTSAYAPYVEGDGRTSPTDTSGVLDAGELPALTPDPGSGQQVYVKTNARGEAEITYNVGQTEISREVIAEIRQEIVLLSTTPRYNFTVDRVVFNVNGTGSSTQQPQQPTQQPIQQQPQVTTLTVASSLSGAPGSTQTLRITSPVRPTVGTLTDTFRTAGGSATSVSGAGPLYTTTLTLPSAPGTYSLTVAAGLTTRTVTVTVTGATDTAPQAGDLFITSDVSGAPGSQSRVTIRATTADNSPAAEVSVALGVTNGGGTFSPATVTTRSDGTAISTLTRGSTPGTNYFITARANNYDTVQSRISITGTAPPTTPTTTTTPRETAASTAGDPGLISIEGEATRSGTINQELDAPLVVEVLDSKGARVSNARVTFRVRKGQGRLSQRGNGRAIAVQTDSRGYARADYTPMSASSTVEAEVRGVARTVTFTITTDGSTPQTDTSDSTTRSYKVRDEIPISLEGTLTFRGSRTINGITYTCVGSGECVVSFGTVVKGEIQAAPEKTTPQQAYKVRDEIPISLEDTLSFTGKHTVNGTIYTCVGPGECVVSFGTVVKGEIRVSAAASTSTRSATEITPEVKVQTAHRPMMVWIDGGGIYALAGADVQEFAPSVENAVDIAIHGNTVYWIEQTSERSGTVNSATLNGSNAKVLKTLTSVPKGLAVDTANRKLYLTNGWGKIQRMNLDGSRYETNFLTGLTDPMHIAVADGNVYWTEAGGRVRAAHLTGAKTPRNIVTGAGTLTGLAAGGSKVFWTEQTGENRGSVRSANPDGTGVTVVYTVTAAVHGLAIDAANNRLYWTNGWGKVQRSANASRYQDVVTGLMNPTAIAIGGPNAETPAEDTPKASTPTTAANKYDVNGDGSVDSKDVTALIDAISLGVTAGKYDVNGDGTVDILDAGAVNANLDAGAAAAPTRFGMKVSAVQIERLQEQIDLLIATGDRSPSTMKLLIYLQQLIVMARPEQTQLLANYPNPFNPETWIPYELATDTDVRITIYNAQGVVVRVLHLGQQSAGYYTDRERAAYWDGRNALGEQVASGVYFYQLETDDMSSLRKMVILK